MSTDSNSNPPPPPSTPESRKSALFRFPALVAISLYMLLLAAFTTIRVVSEHGPLLFLIFPVLFIAGALGLLLLLRWAWALTLAAVAFAAGWCLWSFSIQRYPALLLYGLLNLVLFLYLVRAEVRSQLR